MLVALLFNLALIAIATAIIWKSSERLEAASQNIADYYGLPEIIKGAVITAVGSSFPELLSVLLATVIHGEFELGVSAIVGSAIFNILVIPACSVFFGAKLIANRELVYKEAQFYLISVAVLLLTFSFSVIYFPVPGDVIQGQFTRTLALIPIGLYVIYLFLQYQDAQDDRMAPEHGSVSSVGREWVSLVGSMVVVALGVEMLIRAALQLGDLFNTPSFLWGLTVIAAGTSLPDLFISVTAARKGMSVTSLSNVLGSNTFDLLIAVPVGVLVAGTVVINFSRAAPMMGCLTFATIVMFVLMRHRMALSRGDAWALMMVYAAFVIWAGMETFGVTHVLLLNGAP